MLPKIADFGISKFFNDQKLETLATTAIGSLGYMAPEYISGNIVSKNADIYSLGVIIMQIITGRRIDVTSCEHIVEPVLENWSKRMEAKTSITDCEQIRICLKIGTQCVEFIKEARPSIKEILQILYTWEDINNGYASGKETYKLMDCNNMCDKESHCNKKEATIEEIVEERKLMGDADDDRNGFSDEEMLRSVNEKLLGGARESEEVREAVRKRIAKEMFARVGGMVPAALDAVRAAGGFPGLWKAIAHNLEKLRACLHNPSFHQACQLETKNKAVCRELLQSVADMLAWATDIAGRCRGPLTAGKMQMRSSIDEVAVKLDISLRDCELLLKIGELYDEGPLDGTSTCVELQRLLAWLEMSHTEAKILALDGLLEALNKDEKRVVSMFGRDNVSAVVQLLTASWPEVVRDKAATVVCHVVITGSSNAWQLLESEVAIPPLIRLAKSGSQKAVVTLHHLSSTSFNTAWVIVSHGGIGPLIDMCNCCVKTGGDSVSQSAAAGTLKNISAAPHVRQLLADHGTVGAMVGLLHCSDALPESKEHAAECLINFTSSANDDCLRRAVVSEGGLYVLLLYLGDTNWHEAGVRAIRNLVGVISTTSGDTTTMMKRLGGEQRCVPLLVRTMRVESGVSNSAREVAVQMLASLATYPPNAMKMGKDLACVAGLVHLLDPDRYNTRYKHAIQCLLSLTSTSKRCREIMTLLRTNRQLRRLSDLNVEGATELLHRLEGGRLRSLFGIRKQ